MSQGGARPGAGRKPGSKSPTTLEREAALKSFRDMVIEQTKPLFIAQLQLAKGCTFVYRVTIGARGGRSDPVLVTDQDELFDAIQSIDSNAGYGDIAEDIGGENDEQITHRYYFLTTKAPDNKALDSLLDRALGKAVGLIELPPDADTGSVVEFIFKRNENSNAGTPADNQTGSGME
jgi:hypothetical protein